MTKQKTHFTFENLTQAPQKSFMSFIRLLRSAEFGFNGSRSLYQYSNIASRLSRQICIFFYSFLCLTILKRDLKTKKLPPNVEVCPDWSLLAMSERWLLINLSSNHVKLSKDWGFNSFDLSTLMEQCVVSSRTATDKRD